MKYQAEINAVRAKHPQGVHISCEPQVGELLYALVRLCQPVVAVEIGVFMGYSTYHLLSALAANGTGKLYAIDGFDPDPGIRAAPECVFMQERSATAVPKLPYVDFAFVDGDHSYAGVRADIDALMPKLKPGSIMVFHDTYSYDDVGRAVRELPGDFERLTLPTPVLPERALAYNKPSGLVIARKL